MPNGVNIPGAPSRQNINPQMKMMGMPNVAPIMQPGMQVNRGQMAGLIPPQRPLGPPMNTGMHGNLFLLIVFNHYIQIIFKFKLFILMIFYISSNAWTCLWTK